MVNKETVNMNKEEKNVATRSFEFERNLAVKRKEPGDGLPPTQLLKLRNVCNEKTEQPWEMWTLD